MVLKYIITDTIKQKMKNINIEFKRLSLYVIVFCLLIMASYYCYNVSSNPTTPTISNDIKREVNLREREIIDFSNSKKEKETRQNEYHLDLGGYHTPWKRKETVAEINSWVKNAGSRTGFYNTSYHIEEKQTKGGLFYLRIYSEDQLFLQKIHEVFNSDVESFKRKMQKESQDAFDEKQKSLEHQEGR